LSNMELPHGVLPFPIIEVRFKNGRKDFFRTQVPELYQQGDVVAVEASPGHDIGVVSLSGELVRFQLKKRNIKTDDPSIKTVYRKAKQLDIEKWQSARELEEPTMFKARQIAQSLKLQMKISDVEYQGDKTKAVFYYTADDRVDFRELIKLLAEEFRIRVEMRQIGARQEASRLGGIGSCGRELCCSTWLTDFRSVTTSAARYQQLSLNPIKLAGQCGKLKCCLNYELDSYLDAIKDFPTHNEKIQTQKGIAFHQKTDIFRRILWYSYADDPSNFIALSVERVKFLIESNKDGVVPESLIDEVALKKLKVEKLPDFENVVGQDSLTRFDHANKSKKKKKKKKPFDKPTAQAGGSDKSGINEGEATKVNRPRPQSNQPKPQQTQGAVKTPMPPRPANAGPKPQGTGPKPQAAGAKLQGNQPRPQGEGRNNHRRPRPQGPRPEGGPPKSNNEAQ
jgi:cell fate regulator YaaT (PSP1 superfamily)